MESFRKEGSELVSWNRDSSAISRVLHLALFHRASLMYGEYTSVGTLNQGERIPS
jgi:hypothetical protein